MNTQQISENALPSLPENSVSYEQMLQDLMNRLETAPETAVCPPPKAPCKAGHYMGWLALNAIAYGFKRGTEAAGVQHE